MIFSKTRLPHIEETYATHYVHLKRIYEMKMQKAAVKNDSVKTTEITDDEVPGT